MSGLIVDAEHVRLECPTMRDIMDCVDEHRLFDKLDMRVAEHTAFRRALRLLKEVLQKTEVLVPYPKRTKQHNVSAASVVGCSAGRMNLSKLILCLM